MGQQSVDHRTVRGPGSGVDNQAGGFVDYDQIRILILDIEFHRFRLDRRIFNVRNNRGESLTLFDAVGGVGYRLPVLAHVPL